MGFAVRRIKAAPGLRLVRKHGVPDPLDDEEVRRLTREFLREREQFDEMCAAAAARMGKTLVSLRRRLGGRYADYVKHRLQCSIETASKYVTVYRLKQEEPGMVRRYRSAGFEKLCRLARLTAEGKAFVRAQVPPSRLRTLGVRQFERLTKPFWKRRPATCPGRRAIGLCLRLESWIRVLGVTALPRPRNVALRLRMRKALATLGSVVGHLERQLRR
jgi:hypothetical protein